MKIKQTKQPSANALTICIFACLYVHRKCAMFGLTAKSAISPATSQHKSTLGAHILTHHTTPHHTHFTDYGRSRQVRHLGITFQLQITLSCQFHYRKVIFSRISVNVNLWLLPLFDALELDLELALANVCADMNKFAHTLRYA